MLHSIQCKNKARLKQLMRVLQENGYNIASDLETIDGVHVVEFWSLVNKTYKRVSRTRHSELLHAMRIPKNRIDSEYPHVISTYTRIPTSSRTRRRATLSPIRR
jgi:hypothetical protein